MEKEQYPALYNMEDDYWWHTGLRSLVFSLIDKFRPKKDNLRILDAGCGTGGLLSKLGRYKSYGFDISEEAIKFCKLRKINNMVKASVCHIPFGDNSFNFIVSLGVLYHQGVKNDIQALEELYRVAYKGGIVLLDVPAYDFLKGRHDKAVYTRHRYSLRELKQKVEKAGFVIEKITYRHAFFFLLIAIKRFVEKMFSNGKVESASELVPLPNLINKFFTQALLLENRLLSFLNLPFGLTVFCVARKK